MRRTALLAVLFCCGQICAQEKQDALNDKYDDLPECAYQILLDHVTGFPAMDYKNPEGSYYGQVAPDVRFYGYGDFQSGVYRQTGIFRNGKFAFGITCNDENAIVGSQDHYAVYDLKDGTLQYVYHNKEKILLPARNSGDACFLMLTYQNGDRYIGEMKNGKRHGYGIYFYKSGNFWFGQYKNGVRQGFGALFRTDKSMKIGQWLGEDALRTIPVKPFETE